MSIRIRIGLYLLICAGWVSAAGVTNKANPLLVAPVEVFKEQIKTEITRTKPDCRVCAADHRCRCQRHGQ